MKGFLYYEKDDAIRNEVFIDQLIAEAKRLNIDLQLIVNGELPTNDARFVLFRGRNYKTAKSFEEVGIRVFNRSEVNRIANNKWTTFELGMVLGIPVIPTKKVTDSHQLATYPTVIKTVDGYGGNEVFLCKNSSEVKTVFKQFPNDSLIAQPYIESNAEDVRVFVLGEEILGAVKRTGNDSFKSNYTLGGSVQKYPLSAEEEKQVLTIARALKSDYIGIDFLLLKEGGWVLNEIEDPVGARSLYNTHDMSIARTLMNYIKKEVK